MSSNRILANSQERLRQLPDFFRTSQRIQQKYCALFFKKSDAWHCAAIVSKKVSKRAVDRNTIKRRVRAICQEYSRNNIQPSLFGVFVVRPQVRLLTFRELKAEIENALQRAQKKIV